MDVQLSLITMLFEKKSSIKWNLIQIIWECFKHHVYVHVFKKY
jgi:hypothetical protein